MNYISITYEEVEDVLVGEIFVLRGKRYKLLKKTSTAVSIKRWYWFDDFGVWLCKKLKIENENDDL